MSHVISWSHGDEDFSEREREKEREREEARGVPVSSFNARSVSLGHFQPFLLDISLPSGRALARIAWILPRTWQNLHCETADDERSAEFGTEKRTHTPMTSAPCGGAVRARGCRKLRVGAWDWDG